MLSCKEADVVGEVVSVKKDVVTVELDPGAEISTGTHLAVIPASKLETHPTFGSALVCKHNGGVTAVIKVDSVTGSSASGTIGRASAAKPGDLVFVTPWQTTHWKWWPIFPEAYGDIWELSTRFFIMPDFYESGVSFDASLSISYQFSFPLRIQLSMVQLGIAKERRYIIGLLPAFIASYSSRFFEVGFGVGMHTSNMGPFTGVSLFQTVRIGAEDGLMGRVTTVFKYYSESPWEDEPTGFYLDSVFWEVKAPIHARVTFFMESWTGIMPPALFRLTGGIQLMFNGTGGPGTIIVPIGVGGGFLDWWDPGCELGPSECWHQEIILESFVLTTGITMRW